jgi:hypothetical protein
VRADPKPEHIVDDVGAQGAVSDSDANRPVTSNLLEVQGRVPVIGLQKLIVTASEQLNLRRKAIKSPPELR